MTKIMTALIAIEEMPNFQKKIRIPGEMFDVLYAENASRAGFEPGEAVTVEDLIYGVLLPSGAECCLTLANEIAGSEQEFVNLMNKKAREIGMENTQFRNSIGLHDESHYSTASDMAKLLRYALKSSTFRNVFTSNQYTTSPSNFHPKGLTFNSTLFRYLENATVTGGQLLGGKTGYTQEAGQCLASLADIEGEEYILVTAGAPGDQMTEQLHIDDAIKIFDRLGEELEEWGKERSQ
jgi:D-alanyl-D-alanine carboxypeptidase (penicillin-binding protein 5/6)